MKKSNGKLQNHLKTNENGNKTLQNLWDATKAILRGKFIVIQASSMARKSQTIGPNLHPKGIRGKKRKKEKSSKAKVSKMKEILKISEDTDFLNQ